MRKGIGVLEVVASAFKGSPSILLPKPTDDCFDYLTHRKIF